MDTATNIITEKGDVAKVRTDTVMDKGQEIVKEAVKAKGKVREIDAAGVIADTYRFYVDGFKNLTLGKTLWKIIAIKLAVMFLFFKILFFSDTLHTEFSTPEERGAFVLEKLTKER